MVNHHSAQATFQSTETFRLHIEADLMSAPKAIVAETAPKARHFQDNDLYLISSPAPTSRTLCTCGAVVEMDRNVLRTKRSLGKMVECRRCRNSRIALEKAELDQEFFGSTEVEND